MIVIDNMCCDRNSLKELGADIEFIDGILNDYLYHNDIEGAIICLRDWKGELEKLHKITKEYLEN